MVGPVQKYSLKSFREVSAYFPEVSEYFREVVHMFGELAHVFAWKLVSKYLETSLEIWGHCGNGGFKIILSNVAL